MPRKKTTSSPGRALYEAWLVTMTSPPMSKTYSQIGKMVGCSKQAIANIRAGRYAPGRKLASSIAKISGGLVPATSWDQ